jgi:hypothetical protein
MAWLPKSFRMARWLSKTADPGSRSGTRVTVRAPTVSVIAVGGPKK